MMKKPAPIQDHSFAARLLEWDRTGNDRPMPWKGEKDPYRIWLSEIILQQTRVEQGWDYYNRFISAYPDIHSLSNAPDADVFKLWEGLGYYTRCRNLIHTAKYISEEKNGRFPDNYHDILNLKGVGPYTAAAISSFAFNLPYAVLDGNVFRVLARYFGIKKNINSPEGKREFSVLAGELLDQKQPGVYNQAMMDFGAVICKPVIPRCTECPFRNDCFAYNHNLVETLPVKGKKAPVKKRWFYYIVLEHNNKVAIRKRVEKDIWQDLYEFPLIEKESESDHDSLIHEALMNKWVLKKDLYNLTISGAFRQQLTHQLISGRFLGIVLRNKPVHDPGWIWVPRSGINAYPFPNYINQFLRDFAG